MTPPTNSANDPWAGGIYSIKRHGVTITNCDSEPVQTPGCIQAHGALLVLRLNDLVILQASENTAEYLGDSPEQLLGQSVERVLGAARTTHLRGLLVREPLDRNPVYAFSIPARGNVSALDISVHTIDGLVVLEFEAIGRTTEPAGGDHLAAVKTAISRLQAASGLQDFCQRATQEVRAATGLDRVMMYRFHADHHGEVIAESKRDDLPPWLGLHYPESDIPKPAREIFKRIWIRPLPNAAGPLVELVPLANPDTGRALNMTYCALRGASVMYTEYLANMGVGASLTMAIRREGELWGLIACHHYTPTQFPFQTRAVCELLAQVVSLQLKSAEQNEQLTYRLRLENVHQQLVAKAARGGDLMELTDTTPSLLDAMDAGGGALYHLNRWWCVGQTPTPAQLDPLLDWLYERPEFNSVGPAVFVTDSLALAYPPGAEICAVASGLLVVPLSRQHRSVLAWFRPETIRTVNWGGNPHDKPLVTGPNGPRLTPRRSFELFVESVARRSLPWLQVEIDSALRLRTLIMELVVARAQRLADLNAELTRSNEELDAFAYVASHDLKEPLRGIRKYAQAQLESAQASGIENRDQAEGLLRLTVRMDGLLDSLLYYSRAGRTELELEEVDLNEVFAEALDMVGARRRDSGCAINLPRLLPKFHCDRVRAREIFSNLLSNAMKYTKKKSPIIEVGFFTPAESSAVPEMPLEARGQIIFYVGDDGIGIERRNFPHIFQMFKRLHGREEFGGGGGVGLTIVQKLAQRHGGVVWLDSVVGRGTTFYFTLARNNEI